MQFKNTNLFSLLFNVMRNKTYSCQLMKQCLFITLTLLIVPNSYSQPFSHCPSKAFLFQGKPVASYGVNLVTGNFEVLEEDSGTNANINGVGFNETDRYLYGFNTADFTLVRMDKDFQVIPLNLTGLPADKSFFVGDVAEHHYYVYRKNTGFFKVDLSPLDNDVNALLTAELITSTSNINLTDFAFHPKSKKLYGVDNATGFLFQINPSNGEAIQIADTGQKGTFGAMYFDVNGYFYLSRNQDGNIYRIDLSTIDTETNESELLALNVEAIKFADGPSSSQNDGARCASAPLIDEDIPSTVDFGDAPKSYGTTLADNGARHLLDNETFLGFEKPDGDYDGYIGSDSDDSTVINELSFNDEDGVLFVTSLEAGLDSVISIYASKPGVLSAWFDWNLDGDFADENEHTITNLTLQEGTNIVAIRVPAAAKMGKSWSRFRFSQQSDLNYFGGSTSGEVEDYAITISEPDLSYRYYPGENTWVTLAYEDKWPKVDDYDLNDVVLYYRTAEVIKDGQVIRIDIQGELQAVGGVHHNGFAIQLEGINTNNVNQETLRLLHNNIKQRYSGKNGATTYDILEKDNKNAVVVISQDLWKHVSTNCNYYRTEENCEQAQLFDFEISIPLNSPIATEDMPSAPYDPFIFATEGLYHGESFNQHPGRGLEIHLADKAPTDKFNANFYQLDNDTSNPEIARYFRNNNNLPWAIEIPGKWHWPKENKPLLDAYPNFQRFVESQGVEHTNWYEFEQANAQHLFK